MSSCFRENINYFILSVKCGNIVRIKINKNGSEYILYIGCVGKNGADEKNSFRKNPVLQDFPELMGMAGETNIFSGIAGYYSFAAGAWGIMRFIDFIRINLR